MGWLLLVPFFLLRFGLLALLDRKAVGRAAHFAPLAGGERAAYWVYQLSNAALFLCLAFQRIRPAPPALLCAGGALYLAGCGLLGASVAAFASPPESGFCQRGLYRLSRNPMYVSYFLYFLGCALLTRSLLLLGLLLVFQTAGHWIIRAEERWCAGRFGPAYLQYMQKVRRYI